jgi:hypothetical protein
MLFFISRNFGKLVKNLKEYKTKLYLAIKVSVIKIDNDFNHRNFYHVSQTFKFRRYLYFWQVVRSSNCPFGKMSVRQNVRRQNVRSAKCLSAKCPVTQLLIPDRIVQVEEHDLIACSPLSVAILSQVANGADPRFEICKQSCTSTSKQ